MTPSPQTTRERVKKLIYKIVKKWFSFVFDMWTDEIMEEASLKEWYKARRSGWKKKDMSYWYADKEYGKRTNILGMEDNYIL